VVGRGDTVRLSEFKITKSNKEFPPLIIDNLKDCKRQYFGYVNEKGERIIYFNFLIILVNFRVGVKEKLSFS
jgi:hypothetical protein